MDVERGAAWRRRQRRLRSWWRHEQQTVAAVLATVTHHSLSNVGTAYDAPRGQKKVTSTRVGPAEYFELSSDDGRPTGSERPAALLEPWPHGKTERHDGIAYELVQALDAPVLQTVEQLPNVVQFFATQYDVAPRRLCRDTRSWRNSWWKCRRFSTSSSSGFPSRSTTIQFRMVVVELPEVFKAFSLDTVR